MNETIAFYQRQAKASCSSIPWLAKMQRSACAQLGESGFPSRCDENWKYTSVEPLVKACFAPAHKQIYSSQSLQSTIPIRKRLFLHNGEVKGLDALKETLPSKVIVLPLASALVEYPSLIKPHLGKILLDEHGFSHMNTAMIEQGVFFYVPAGVQVSPIALVHVQDQATASYLRHLIIAEKNSQCTVVEEYQGLPQCAYFTNTVTEIFVGENAHVSHYKIQNESQAAYHIGQLAVTQRSKSHFTSHSLSLGGKLVRSDLCIDLQEEFSECLMNGIYAPNQGSHVDHHTSVRHQVPRCKSLEDYKGILSAKSRAVFNGKVFVAKGALGTDAKQSNKNLLLAKDAEIDTKPQLEIFADDVFCSHGATVGQLDEEALFYLATRGIGQLEASQYLIQAFGRENLALIEHKPLADWMSHLLSKQLESTR